MQKLTPGGHLFTTLKTRLRLLETETFLFFKKFTIKKSAQKDNVSEFLKSKAPNTLFRKISCKSSLMSDFQIKLFFSTLCIYQCDF